jgi:hypothetical protein
MNTTDFLNGVRVISQEMEIQPGKLQPFLGILMLDEGVYSIIQQLRNSIKKECEELERWEKVSQSNYARFKEMANFLCERRDIDFFDLIKDI